MFLTGAARTVKIISESITTAIGLRITKRAVCAHLPSSFGVIELFLTTNLSILFPKIASSAGSATNAPSTASITTVTPAYPKDLRNICGNKTKAANVITIVKPE